MVRRMRLVAIALACLALVPGATANATREATVAAASSPCGRTLVFWAWERREDLRFLDASCTAVAWYAGQVDIDATALRFTPRQQPLTLAPAQANWPVLRVDAFGAAPTSDQDRERRHEFLRTLRKFVHAEQLGRGLQLDFDAPRSWRPFYARLLRDVRSLMPSSAPLTMTALASWCLGDPWLREAPVAEAIPMLFRMGPDGPHIRRDISAGRRFTAAVCHGSVGLALDEAAPESILQSSARVYVFAPRAWTPSLVSRAYTLARVRQPRLAVREK